MSRWKKWRALRTEAEQLAEISSSEDETESDILNAPNCSSDGTGIPTSADSVDLVAHQGNSDSYSDQVLEVPTEPYTSSDDFGMNSTSSDSEADVDGEVVDERSRLRVKLATWAIENGQTRKSVNSLLAILREEGHHDLPRDTRTLLKTPRNVEVTEKCGGQYLYFGIENGIRNILLKTPEYAQDKDILHLKVNVDGLPIFKSTSDSLWPILMTLGLFSPFIVALFYGKSKPNSLEEYLRDFVDELKDLNDNGIIINDKVIQISIDCFLCDAPARAFLKAVKYHSGYSSCERCTQHGTWEGRVVYNVMEHTHARTDAGFANMEYQEEGHQMHVSPLAYCGVQCVSQFPLDYLHLVCLGVMKRILYYLKNGPRKCKLSAGQMSLLSAALSNYRGKMPSEFARQPRGLDELERWKATEFRQFMLYTGPLVLKDIVSPATYTHFLSLSVALSILLEDKAGQNHENINYARELLAFFVKNCTKIYGKTFAVYNVHNLLHLADDAEKYGCSLNEISCFEYENHLQILKKLVRNSKNPISQILKRENERQTLGTQRQQCRDRFNISTRPKDCCFVLQNGSFCLLRERRDHNTFVADIVHPHHGDNLFTRPCPSTLLKVIYVPSFNTCRRRLLHKEELKQKAVCLPHRDGYVIMPLLHSPEK